MDSRLLVTVRFDEMVEIIDSCLLRGLVIEFVDKMLSLLLLNDPLFLPL